MRVIIAGSRTITKYSIVAEAITDSEFQITEVVSGACRGVDKLGEQWANVHDIPIKPFPYPSGYGKAGGPIRNRQMADYADALIAVYDGTSHGTANMIDEARKRGLRIYVYEPKKGD